MQYNTDPQFRAGFSRKTQRALAAIEARRNQKLGEIHALNRQRDQKRREVSQMDAEDASVLEAAKQALRAANEKETGR